MQWLTEKAMERLMSDGPLIFKNKTAEFEQSLKGFRYLADSVPQIIWTAQPDGNLDYYNQHWFDYTGLTLEQTKDWGWGAVLHPDDLQLCVDRWTHAYKSGEDYEIEYRFKRASDGSFRWHLGRAAAMRGEDGEIVQWVGTCTDIDDFKRSEKALRDSEHRIHIVLENITEGLVISNMEGELVYWNRAGLDMHGFAGIEEGRKMLPDFARIFDLRTLDGTLLTVDEWPLARVFRGEVLRNFDVQILRRDIEWSRIFSYGGALVLGTTGQQLAFVTITDITLRKQAEDALREVNDSLEQNIALRTAELLSANQQLQAVLDASTDVSIIAGNPQGEITLFNRGAEKMLGYKSEEMLGSSPAILHVEAEVLARGRELTGEYGRPIGGFDVFVESVRQGKREEREWTYVRKDGTTFPVTLVITASHGSDGKIDGFLGVAMDITARKEAEAQLRESEERFRGAFQNSAIGMALVSLEGRWLRVNDALCEIVGRTEEQLLACSFQDITHPDDLGRDMAQLRSLLVGEIDHYQIEKRYFHLSGRIVWVLLAVTLVRSANGQPIHFVSQINDITLRLESAARLQSSLEEKEVLLREIHHRVKNNMQVITSLLQLQSSYLQDPRDAEIFRECQARIHAMGLVHDRLYRSGNLATIDFSAHLRDLIALIVRGQSTGPERIQVKVESDPVEVNLDTAIPLGLITTELITNAYKHAFPHGATGTIHVLLASTGNGGLTLRVEDNGVGLPAELVPDKARTLGMRLIRALCQQLQAKISISSSDKGSQIQISFQPDLSPS